MSRRTRLHMRNPLAAAAAALLCGVLTVPATAREPAKPAPAPSVTDLVNPFIGSQDEGNTYPGATVPFGMVQLSPDTGHNTGYDYGDSKIRGFSAIHLSGVGCGIGGELPVLPTTGDIVSTDYTRYAASFSHDDEAASPGYYKVDLRSYGGIRAELGATTHTGWQRYSFPETDQANVLINTGQALHHVISSSVKVIDDRTVAATITGQGFCQDTRPHTLYTITRFDRPFAAYGTWRGDTVETGSDSSTGEGRNGAFVRFDTTNDQDVVAVTALSYVDAAGARKNLQIEGSGSFEGTVAAARGAWAARLQQVRVSGDDDRVRTFYSALYRSFLAPNVGSDVDGRYTGWDHRTHRAKGFTYYQNWSLWDTYRTQSQLLSLLAPREARDMAISVIKIDEDSGWLPKWGYGTVETNIMTGDPVTPFLVNAFQQGLLKGHEEEAYRALKKNADGVPPADSPYVGRMANAHYLENGFVPHTPTRPREKPGDSDFEHGGSATLEYALADAVLGKMAQELGHDQDARRYFARGQSFRDVFDPRTGFFRARDANGVFAGPDDPADSVGFHEGTAWQYMWLTPQNLPELIRLIGGAAAANKRLDSFFAYDRLLEDPEGTAREVWVNGPYDYYNADKYNPQNEPDLIAPYTYLSTGEPWKTTDVVHAALTLFSDAPNGITGNDDLGTMSSWAVLSAIGIYPIAPGADVWGLSTPIFDEVDIALDTHYYPHGRYRITAPGTTHDNRYIQSVELGGTRYPKAYITTDDIVAGRNLAFTLGPSPSRWGTGADTAPPPIDDGPVPPEHRIAAAVTPSATSVLAGRTSHVELTASAVFTQPGQVTGRVQVAASRPLAVEPDMTDFTLTSDNLPATQEVKVRVTVPPDTPDGTYPVTVRLSESGGSTLTRKAQVIVVSAGCEGASGYCPQDLSAAYDVDGVSSGSSPGEGDFDGTGSSYPAEQLPTPGTGALDGGAYAFPDTGGRAPNFAAARGQTLPLQRRAYSSLELLAAAHHGAMDESATVTYADGSTQTVPLAVTDWASPWPRHGENAAVSTTTRYGADGEPDHVPASIWHLTLPLRSAEDVVSITLPDNPRLLVYALSGRNR